MVGSGAEGPIAPAQHGLTVNPATMVLIGEAGPKAVVG
jgi:hypothetical protein